ncbi:MAG: hypothetical protein HOK58_12600 [Acidimicrobiaceae bacterium]|nr:hypothetical protein [Acidimicrobiaceae bacterium]
MIATVSFAARILFSLVKKPQLIPTAMRQAVSLAPQRWWASGSHLPVPRSDYMAFRNVTLSGNPDELPTAHDAIVYLEWCRSMRALPERG